MRPLRTSPMVGREVELGRLRSTLADVARAGPAMVVCTGDAGVGKSRLVGEFLGTLDRAEVAVLRGGCLPFDAGLVPFAPLLDAVGRWRTEPHGSPPGPAVERLTALLDRSGPPPALSDTRASRQVLLAAITDVLAELAEHRPLVLVIEDLHWIDPSTQALVSFLVRSERPRAMLLLATYREDQLAVGHPVASWLVELERLGADRLAVDPLDRADSARLVRNLVGAVGPAETASIVDRGAGNPLVVEHLCATSGGAVLPKTLRQLLLDRVRGLGPAGQRVAGVVAVAGGRASHRLLAAAWESPPADLLAALRDAVDHHVLDHDGPDGAYRFRHPLFGEAVYDDLLPGERMRLHGRLAAVLGGCPELASGSGGAARHAEVARHLDAAQDWPAALSAWTAAGTAAERTPAVTEARRYFERALAALAKLPVPSADGGVDVAELHEHVAAAAYLDGDPDAAVEHVHAAVAAIDADAEPERAGLLHERLARYMWASGRPEEQTLAVYRRAVELVPARDGEARALVLAALGQALMLAADTTESIRFCEQAVRMAGRAGAPRVECHAMTTLGCDYSLIGEPDRGVELLRTAQRIARSSGTEDDVFRAYTNLSLALARSGRRDEAITVAGEGARLAERRGLGSSHGVLLLGNVVDSLNFLGRWDEAERCLHRALGPRGFAKGHASLHLAGVWLCTARARFVEAGEHLELARRALAGGGDSLVRLQLLCAEAELAGWQHRHDDARRCGRQAVRMLAGKDLGEDLTALAAATWLRAEADHRGELAADGLQPDDDDRAALAAAQDLFHRLDGRRLGPDAAAHVATARAEAARAHGRPDAALWRRAVTRWERQSCVYGVAYGRWREAQALAAGNEERARAGRSLAQARRLADRLGAVSLGAEIDALAGRLGGVPAAPVTPAAPAGGALSSREHEVLLLVAEGRTNRQIARSLTLSEKTVEKHVSRLLAKLGAANRGEAAAIAHRTGMLAC